MALYKFYYYYIIVATVIVFSYVRQTKSRWM